MVFANRSLLHVFNFFSATLALSEAKHTDAW